MKSQIWLRSIQLLLASSITFAGPIYAADWSTSSVSLLTGKNYTDPFSDKTENYETATFEHASAWAYVPARDCIVKTPRLLYDALLIGLGFGKSRISSIL